MSPTIVSLVQGIDETFDKVSQILCSKKSYLITTFLNFLENSKKGHNQRATVQWEPIKASWIRVCYTGLAKAWKYRWTLWIFRK